MALEQLDTKTKQHRCVLTLRHAVPLQYCYVVAALFETIPSMFVTISYEEERIIKRHTKSDKQQLIVQLLSWCFLF